MRFIMSVEIRDMNDSDWIRVSQIYEDAIKIGKSTFSVACPTYEQWDTEHLKDCRFVLTVDNNVAGWCAISKTSSKKAYWGVVEESIYFDRAYQGMGYGTKLMNHICEESEKKGYWCLYACIFSNNLISINMHEKCGFRKFGIRENIAKDIFGMWQSTTLYEKRSKIIY